MIPKFRAWDKKLKLLGNVLYIDFDSKNLMYFFDKETEFYANFEDVEIMQSTGLSDKNGVEIYEGDILQGEFYYGGFGWFDTGEGDFEINKKVVLYENGKFICNDFDLSDMNECIEIIGNIYENMELLEG